MRFTILGNKKHRAAIAIFLIAALTIAMLGIREKKAEAMSGEENGYRWYYTAAKGDPDSPATNVYLNGNVNETVSSPVVVPEYFTDSEGAVHYVESVGGSIGTDSFFVGFDNLSNITIDATNCTRLTTVNNCAVYDRTGIIVQLPETVTTIGEDAFAGGSQNSVSCENPNIAFAGEDHTGTGFQFTGTSHSTAYERYNASGKFKSNGLSAFRLSLDANDDTTDPAEMGTGILQDSVYVFAEYDTFSDKNDQENYTELSTLKSVPTRPHYTFEGFYTEPEGGTQLIDSEGKVNTANVTSLKNTEDTTAYARWIPDRYTITYVPGEGTVGGAASQIVTYGQPFDIDPFSSTKKGYSLMGWSTDGTDHIIYDKEQKGCSAPAEDISLYAVWQENQYTIEFDANGGTGVMNSKKLKYTSSYELPDSSFTRNNYTFLGWGRSEEDEYYFDVGESVNGLSDEKDGKVTLYAIWTANSYTVRLDGNGATGGSMQELSAKYDTAFCLPVNNYNRNGYKFKGWAETADAGEAMYEDGAEVENLPVSNGESVLYAVWEKLPDVVPTATPTAGPTEPPTTAPTAVPTEEPTEPPTTAPTAVPTEEPTEPPTTAPTAVPTEEPTESPTTAPTVIPTEEPTESPTTAPTAVPTEEPTEPPTTAPTAVPTEEPTESPTIAPTTVPTEEPVEIPTKTPAEESTPTLQPTRIPEPAETTTPTMEPGLPSLVLTATPGHTVIPSETGYKQTPTPYVVPPASEEPKTTKKTISNITYQVSGKTARVTKGRTSIKKAVIQDKVQIGGKKYKVTSIGKNAFKRCKKLRQVIIKTPYLKSVAKSAFKGCKKLKTVKVPKSCKKKYKKLLKKAGLGKKVKIK